MESFPSPVGPTQPVPHVPLTMRSTPSTKTKKISAAAAAELAAAATATVKYDRWERVPRELDHLCRSAQDTKNQIVYQRQLRGGQMDEKVLHRMRLDAAQKYFGNMKQIEKDQYERKARLWEEIERNENNTYENANEMLRKYERLKSGIVRIHKNFQKDLDHEQKELITMKESSESKIKDIEEELSIMDSLLETQNTEYTELLNYKHEMYPQNAMTIEGLEANIEEIRQDNEREREQISYVMSSEMARHKQHWNNEEDEMAKIISEMSFDLMPPDIKKMMVENVIMTKEIKSHLKAKEDMEKQINSLTEEVKHLSRLNFRMQIFPEFFTNKVKCNPDLDIELDIPQKTFLPI